MFLHFLRYASQAKFGKGFALIYCACSTSEMHQDFLFYADLSFQGKCSVSMVVDDDFRMDVSEDGGYVAAALEYDDIGRSCPATGVAARDERI